MAIIVPALLEKDIESFKDHVVAVSKLPELTRIQIDFADGKFVPNTTLAISDIDPLSPGFTWEAHLMVHEPVDFLDYQIAGFGVIVVHYEAFEDVSKIGSVLIEIKQLGMKAGLAINPTTPVTAIRDFLPVVDQVLIMSIEPGFQGREFLPGTINRVAELRELWPHGILEVDGGIKVAQVSPLIQAGADLLVVGSALFETEKIRENFDALARETIS